MSPIYYLVPVIFIGGYYVYFFLLGGKKRFSDSYRKKFGLRDAEVVHGIYSGYFAFEKSVGNTALTLFGAGERGAHVLMALTNQGRLLIGHNEAGGPPMSFQEGEVSVIGSGIKPNYKTLAGPTGKSEPTQVIQLTSVRGNVHLELPQGAVAAIQTWTSGGGVPALQTNV